MGELLAYAVALARDGEKAPPSESLLRRNDEAGQLARLLLHCAGFTDADNERGLAAPGEAQ